MLSLSQTQLPLSLSLFQFSPSINFSDSFWAPQLAFLIIMLCWKICNHHLVCGIKNKSKKAPDINPRQEPIPLIVMCIGS